MVDRIYVGDASKTLKIRVFDDAETETLTGATDLKLSIERPDETVFEKTATISTTTPADKFLQATLAAGDLNQAGVYVLHSEHELGSTDPFIGNKTTFEVFEKFKGPSELNE